MEEKIKVDDINKKLNDILIELKTVSSINEKLDKVIKGFKYIVNDDKLGKIITELKYISGNVNTCALFNDNSSDIDETNTKLDDILILLNEMNDELNQSRKKSKNGKKR